MAKDLSRAGLEAAALLTKNFKGALIYEKLMEFIFNEMNKVIDLDQISIYLIDNEMKNLKEEATYSHTGWIPGYDFISSEEISPLLTTKKTLTFKESQYHYLQILLYTGSQLLGLMEFRTLLDFNEDIITEIKDMTKIISLGLRNVLFEADTIREKENTEFFIKINNELQSIDKLNILMDTFLKMTVNYYKFDRVSVFLFNKEQEIIFAKSINEKEDMITIKNLPEIPDLADRNIIIDDNYNYWFPLKTNTGIAGVVLYDNIYTLYKISESLLNTLRILTNQFANAIDNIRMFSSLQQSAYFDALTGLLNRAYLEKILPEYDRKEVLPLSIIIGDLNGLKITNDIFGHSAGDSLLVKTADILKASCSEDALVFRWGGDEYFVLLPGKNEVETYDICKYIKEKCSKINIANVNLSISLGYATKKDYNEDIKAVMKKAEDRMYRSKLLETKSYRSSLISSLKETLAEKSHESSEHAERMIELAIKIGKKKDLMGSELDDLRLFAMLHDVGKVAIRDEILNKDGPLDEKEWEEIKKHPEIGYRIAQASQELSHISNYILSHHERWDGKGYPLGKKEKEIPLPARILAVVDAYDVMTHARPYKKAVSHNEAVKELQRCAGTQFDPEIVQIIMNMEINNKICAGIKA